MPDDLQTLKTEIESALPLSFRLFINRLLGALGKHYTEQGPRDIVRGVAPDGTRHQELAEASKYPRKKRRDPANVPIYDTGDLARSFEFTVNGTRVDIGPTVPYAPYHQEPDGVPERAMVGESKQANDNVIEEMRNAFGGDDIYELMIEATEEALM